MIFYQHQDIIFNEGFLSKEIAFIYGKKINDTLDYLDAEDIQEVYCEDQLFDESIEVKLSKLKNGNGGIHFINGTSFVVKGGLIKEVKLSNKSISMLSCLNQYDIISRMGEPDSKERDILMLGLWPVDEGDVYFYQNKRVTIHFDPDTNRVREVWLK